MMTELPLEQVRTLLAVVDEGTFDAAAVALHVTPSAVSQRVKALEQRTGRVLLQRTKPVRPTESGAVLVRYARQLARLERDAWGELGLSGTGEPTRVSVAVNADSLATWFLPALTRVAGLCFELHREDEDHTAALLREGLVMAGGDLLPRPGAGLHGPSARPDALPAGGRPRVHHGPSRRAAHAGGAVPGAGSGLRPQGRLPGRFRAHGSAGGRPARSGTMCPPRRGSWTRSPRDSAGAWSRRCRPAPCWTGGRLALLTPGEYMDVTLHWQQWRLDSPALAALADAVTATAAETLRR
ncbi:LysR family transcriptional regulator ArgP [Streptomyces echinatus]